MTTTITGDVVALQYDKPTLSVKAIMRVTIDQTDGVTKTYVLVGKLATRMNEDVAVGAFIWVDLRENSTQVLAWGLAGNLPVISA